MGCRHACYDQKAGTGAGAIVVLVTRRVVARMTLHTLLITLLSIIVGMHAVVDKEIERFIKDQML